MLRNLKATKNFLMIPCLKTVFLADKEVWIYYNQGFYNVDSIQYLIMSTIFFERKINKNKIILKGRKEKKVKPRECLQH